MLYAPALTALHDVSIYQTTVLSVYSHNYIPLDQVFYLIRCKILEDTHFN